MSYTLLIGDHVYSSWSLRGWLAFAAFDIPVETRLARLDTPEFFEALADFAPARTVPALRVDERAVLWDTLAIAEMLAERYRDKSFWPGDTVARGLARSMAAEMHSGFSALREHCPMDLGAAYEGFEAPEAALADLARIETLWAAARACPGRSEGPWLFGAYSLADVFYAPIATRIATYGLPVSDEAAAYVAAHLAHPAFQEWRAAALADPHRHPMPGDGLVQRPWPGLAAAEPAGVDAPVAEAFPATAPATTEDGAATAG